MNGMRVLLVDDHALFRAGLKGLLRAWGMDVVGEAEDGDEAVRKAIESRPDLVLMDVRMPGVNGLQAIPLIKKELPETKIVMVTVSEDERDLFEAIKSGAEGYLLKNLKEEEFREMMEAVAQGEAPIQRNLASKILAEFSRQARKPRGKPEQGLSDRETEVLRLIARGDPNKEVASSLFISEETVKYHLRNILHKLHLRNRAQAIAYAVREGLVDEDEEQK